MTPEEMLALIKDPEKGWGNFNVETLMHAMQLWVENDKKRYLEKHKPDENVVACLDTCIDLLRDARMAYYCSLK